VKRRDKREKDGKDKKREMGRKRWKWRGREATIFVY